MAYFQIVGLVVDPEDGCLMPAAVDIVRARTHRRAVEIARKHRDFRCFPRGLVDVQRLDPTPPVQYTLPPPDWADDDCPF